MFLERQLLKYNSPIRRLREIITAYNRENNKRNKMSNMIRFVFAMYIQTIKLLYNYFKTLLILFFSIKLFKKRFAITAKL
jgi:hypothetical protein